MTTKWRYCHVRAAPSDADGWTDQVTARCRGRLQFELRENDQAKCWEMAPGDRVHVPPGAVHRMTAIEDCDVFEVSTPELDDVVRLEDRYGREGTTDA